MLKVMAALSTARSTCNCVEIPPFSTGLVEKRMISFISLGSDAIHDKPDRSDDQVWLVVGAKNIRSSALVIAREVSAAAESRVSRAALLHLQSRSVSVVI